MADIAWDDAPQTSNIVWDDQPQVKAQSNIAWDDEPKHDWGTTDVRDKLRLRFNNKEAEQWTNESNTLAAKTGKVAAQTMGAFSEMADMAASLPGMIARPFTSTIGMLQGRSQKEIEDIHNMVFGEPVKKAFRTMGIPEEYISNDVIQNFMRKLDEHGFDPASEYLAQSLNINTQENPESKALLKNSLMLGLGPVLDLMGRGVKGTAKALKGTEKPPKPLGQGAADKLAADASKQAPTEIQGPPEMVGPEPFKYPELKDEFKGTDPIAEQQARMATEVGDMAPKDRVADSAGGAYYFDKGYPNISTVPKDEAVATATKDVVTKGAESPYMAPKAVEMANAEGVPGVSQIDITRNVPEAAKYGITEPFSDSVGALRPAKGQPEYTPKPIYQSLTGGLAKAKNIGEALDAIREFVPEDQKGVYNALVKTADPLIPYQVFEWRDGVRRAPLENAQGVFSTLGDGQQRIQVRGTSYEGQPNGLGIRGNHGLDAEVTMHEVAHSATEGAFMVAATPELAARPEYAPHLQYVKDIVGLQRAIAEQVQKNVDRSGKSITLEGDLNTAWSEAYTQKGLNPGEFNSYAWTNPEFRQFLKGIELESFGKSAWQAMVDSIKKFFGAKVETKNALAEIDKFLNRLDEIQGVKREDFSIAIDKGYVDGVRYMKDIPEIKDGYDLMAYIRNAQVGDLGYAIVKDIPVLKGAVDILNRNFTTTNQTARIFRHPILTWVAQHIPEIQRNAEVRIQNYKNHLQDVVKLGRSEQLDMFKVLVDIQDPKLEKARAYAEQTGTRENFLSTQGMPDALIPHAIKVLDVMKDLYTNEQISAGRLNRGFPEQPMYFPRSHGGTFKFRILDTSKPPDQQLVYIKGFPSAIEAQQWQTAMAERAKQNPALQVSKVERVDVPGFMDSLGDMMLDEALPDYLRDQVRDLTEKQLVQKRKFELERARSGIGGYVGEEVDRGDSIFSLMRPENNRLLDLMNNRIEDSYRFEVQSRIINEIAKPLLDDVQNRVERPRLTQALNHLVLRELGYDVAKYTGKMDARIEKAATEVGREINGLAAKLRDYNPSDVSLFGPQAVKKMIQNMVWITSGFKLGWNVPVLFTNSTAIPLVGLDGIRTAAKEGVNPVVPALAYQKMMLSPWDTPAKDFMHQAKLEGMVAPRAADLFTITETHGVQGARRITDNILNAARNKIEEGTNYTAILYYYQYYKLTRPELSPTSESFKDLVYKAARSWTGDYRGLATPQFISKMGYLGKLGSNFSKWAYNQTGRLLDDIADIRENPLKAQAYMPMMANLSTQVLMGGMYGMAGVADYEMLRLLGQKFGWWDWRPASAWIEEAQKAGQKLFGANPVPEWMKRGAITEATDVVVKALTDNKESGPDMSGSLRHAPFAQANLVLPQTLWDIMTNAGNVALKKGLELAQMGPGLASSDEKAFVKALPAFMAPVLRDEFKVKRGEEFITQGMKRDEGIYAQSKFEKNLDLFGIQTKKQNTYENYRQYQLWQERTTKTKVTELVDATLNNLNKPELVQRNLTELYNVGGMVAVDNFAKQLMDRPIHRSTTYDERLILQTIESKDPAARKAAFETIQKFIALKSRSTS